MTIGYVLFLALNAFYTSSLSMFSYQMDIKTGDIKMASIEAYTKTIERVLNSTDLNLLSTITPILNLL